MSWDDLWLGNWDKVRKRKRERAGDRMFIETPLEFLNFIAMFVAMFVAVFVAMFVAMFADVL